MYETLGAACVCLPDDVPSMHHVANMDDYRKLRPHLYSEETYGFDKNLFGAAAAEQEKGDLVVLMDIEGFFFWPREVIGIERHLFAFYDQPELLHEINKDMVQYLMRLIDRISRTCVPDMIIIGEDFCGKNGPMVSEEMFLQTVKPYYETIIAHIENYGIIPIVDCDGMVIHPIASIWSLYRPLGGWALERLSLSLLNLSNALLSNHYDYHFGDEKIMARHAVVDGKKSL